MTEMETDAERNQERESRRGRPSEPERDPRSFTGVKPPPWLASPAAPAPAGGSVGITASSEGGGARSAGRGPSAPGSETPSGLGSSTRPPNTCGWGETRGAPRPSPSPAGSNKGAPARGRAQAAPRTERESGARPAWERAGPAGLWPTSARLPGVTGVPVEVVAEAGAPSERGAKERGPEDSPQQGQQPHRPRGPVWSGPARPGPLCRRREKGTKWRRGGCGKGGGVRRPTGHAPA